MLSDALIEAEHGLLHYRDPTWGYGAQTTERLDHILCEIIKLRLELDCVPISGRMEELKERNVFYKSVAAGDMKRYLALQVEWDQLGRLGFWKKYPLQPRKTEKTP